MAKIENTVTVSAQQILDQVQKVVVGKDDVLMWVLAAILAKGHILLEDIPGVGKTTMARAFSKTLGLRPNRVQFTPDVLPSDVTGYSILDSATGKMTYQAGAVLCNLFLADELNRATSRTQAALLEAMEEGQVTVDGISHKVPQPFVVIATQNPTGAAGTQLLPDSQMDRFAVRLSLGYPAIKDEIKMIKGRQGVDPLATMEPILTVEELTALQAQVEKTYIGDTVIGYVVSLMDATRDTELLTQGASPRATLMVIAMAKAVAQLRGRDYVIPEDVRAVAHDVLRHRVGLSYEAEANNITPEEIVSKIINKVEVP